jgi:hypothetical protein
LLDIIYNLVKSEITAWNLHYLIIF